MLRPLLSFSFPLVLQGSELLGMGDGGAGVNAELARKVRKRECVFVLGMLGLRPRLRLGLGLAKEVR